MRVFVVLVLLFL